MKTKRLKAIPSGLIVSEKCEGTLFRYHPDPAKPKYTASWILTADREIIDFMITEPSKDFAMAFAAWVQAQPTPIRAKTAIASIGRALRRFGFEELIKR